MVPSPHAGLLDVVEDQRHPRSSDETKPNSSTLVSAVVDKKSVLSDASSGPNILIPGKFDVICGRGETSYYHEGNVRLRSIIAAHLKDYSTANCKWEKSRLVSLVLKLVRDQSDNGGFLRRASSNAPWKPLPERLAREKIGQLFRDALETQYRSSTASKKRRRVETRVALDESVAKIVHSSPFIRKELHDLQSSVNECLPDAVVTTMFNTTNLRILEEVKRTNAAERLATMMAPLTAEHTPDRGTSPTRGKKGGPKGSR